MKNNKDCRVGQLTNGDHAHITMVIMWRRIEMVEMLMLMMNIMSLSLLFKFKGIHSEAQNGQKVNFTAIFDPKSQFFGRFEPLPKICMKSSYLINYYPHFIDFKMPRLIWITMAETAKIYRNGLIALMAQSQGYQFMML